MNPRNSKAYRDLRAELANEWRAVDAVCWLDGQPIEYSAPANAPEALDLDHVKPYETHPHLFLDRNNCRPSHVRCNRSRGSRAPRPPIGVVAEAGERRWSSWAVDGIIGNMHILKRTAALTTAALTVAALAACTPGPQPTSASSSTPAAGSTPVAETVVTTRNDEYLAAVADFPYDMPDGWEFPESIPPQQYATVLPLDAPGSQVAYGYWRCALVEEAWAAEKVNDRGAVYSFIEQTAQATNEQLPGNAAWSASAVNRVEQRQMEAEAALCQSWLA